MVTLSSRRVGPVANTSRYRAAPAIPPGSPSRTTKEVRHFSVMLCWTATGGISMPDRQWVISVIVVLVALAVVVGVVLYLNTYFS